MLINTATNFFSYLAQSIAFQSHYIHYNELNFDQTTAFVWPQRSMDAILVKVILTSLIFRRQ